MGYQQLAKFAEERATWLRIYGALVSLTVIIFVIRYATFATSREFFDHELAGLFLDMLTTAVVLPIYLIPIYLVYTNEDVAPKEKLFWYVVILLFSWIAALFYFLFGGALSTTEQDSK